MRNIVILGIILALCLMVEACNTVTPNEIPPTDWPHVKVYSDNNKAITINTNEEFSIEFIVTGDPFPILKEQFDQNMVELVDKQVLTGENTDSPIYGWYLFKALKKGKTQITIEHHGHLTEPLIDEKTFDVVVE